MESAEAIAARPKVPSNLYQPIYDWQTRLLEPSPFPNDRKSGVQCSLHIVDLVCIEGVVLAGTKQRLTYEALSYSWGRDAPSHIIRCNSMDCVVSKQLEEALRALCHIDKPRWIWCDAFCVDQNNADEKSKQVQKMQIIFSKAQQVIVWLGPQSVTSKICQSLATWKVLSRRNGTEGKLLRNIREEVAHALSACPWLTRTWVRQEIQAARHIVISSSDTDVLTWDDLTAVSEEAYNALLKDASTETLNAYYQYYDARVIPKNAVFHPLTLIYYINSPRRRPILLRNAQHQHLAQWIASMAPFDTTEPVDKVYGILGLFEPSLRAGHPDDITSLQVDYRRPVAEVYTDVMRRILQQAQNLAWLEAHVFSPEAENKRQLPSWVFDWEAPCIEMTITRLSQVYWEHKPFVPRGLEIETHRSNFSGMNWGAPSHTRGTWTVPGEYYRTIDKVQPAKYETREKSFLPPAIFDLGLWRAATYTHSSTEILNSGFESIYCNFYVVFWAQPGDVIVRLGTCQTYFLLRPIYIGEHECFQYLGSAIPNVPSHAIDRFRQTFTKWYGQEREFVLR